MGKCTIISVMSSWVTQRLGSCPEELKNNEALRAYLQNWNINPDA